MKIFNLILAGLFLLFAAVQFNDPDPWGWTAMYVFVASVCGFAAFGKTNRWVLWTGIAVALAWMFFLLPEFINWVKMGAPNIATGMKAETPYVEFTREFLGLGICLATLVWQLWRVRKR